MAGGAGDDTYIVDSTGDRVIEVGGQGMDTIETTVSLTLVANVENLTLTGFDDLDGTGNALGNTITGNEAANRLYGLAGDDILNGGDGVDTLTGGTGNDTLDGGYGSDTMIGGLGDDTYVVDFRADPALNEAGDATIEKAGEGRDTVIAWDSWTLGANIENLTLAGIGPSTATGNSLDNTITGNDGDNVLSGGGGKDTLAGGLGNDTYLVDSLTVTVVEQAGGGTDKMIFSVSATMGANVEIGVVSGTGATGITGGETDNLIGGNAAANVLEGAGGNDALMGHGGADTLKGGGGNDFLFGGTEVDTLTGGAGSDQFAIGTGGGQGVDKITDFVSGTDTLHVINDYVSGYLLAGGFVNGTSAHDQDDIAIYDKASGKLYVDYDGNGPQARVLLASFTPGTVLAASDIQLITMDSFNAQISSAEIALLI